MAAMSTEVFVDVHTDNKMQPAVSSVETPRPMAPNATMLYKAMNIDANAPVALQRPDMDFFEELANLPIDLLNVPHGADVYGMRKWINEELLNGRLAEHRNSCKIERRRPEVDVLIHDVRVPCMDGSGDSFGMRVYEPQNGSDASRPVILMYHGGGWIHGDPRGDDFFANFFASELGAVVFGVDYRLAPEHPFPAPFEDCCQALDWVVENSSKYNVDIKRIALWGCSAGGNLAAAVALRESQPNSRSPNPPLRLASLVVPATAHPKIHRRFESQRQLPLSENEEKFKDTPKPPQQMVEDFEKVMGYYSGEDNMDNPLVSMLLARPSKSHAPTHVTVAACDELRSQGLAYAQVLRCSGVTVTEEVLPGVPHGFTFPLTAQVTKSWLIRQVDALEDAFR